MGIGLVRGVDVDLLREAAAFWVRLQVGFVGDAEAALRCESGKPSREQVGLARCWRIHAERCRRFALVIGDAVAALESGGG